jgi:TRAP-type mannitol/chloroaromatic compound transport system permease small subunit
LLDAFAAAICILLAKAALKFVMDEYAMGEPLFLGMKTWMVQLIIPFGFTMIALEYCIGVVLDILRIFDSRVPHRNGGKP